MGSTLKLERHRTRPALDRMLRIHQTLEAGAYPNARVLAASLEVSTKSVQRDLDFMRDRLELPIAYDAVRHGYYYTAEVASFPSLQITEGELFALLVAEKALQQYRGTSFEAPLLSAFRKMAQALPETISMHLADWNQTISFHTRAEPIVDLEIFDALAQATAKGLQVRLHYRKPGHRTTEPRVVDPYHLANINGEWFLFAYCHLRRNVRTFVPARVKSVEPTGQGFAPPKRFSLERQLRDSFGVHSGTGRFGVVLRFREPAADYVREKRWHPSQRLRELAGGELEMRLELSSLVEIQRWVLGWGGQVRVLAPPELAASVRAAAEAILEQVHRH
jgi:proteasome accessory factor B